MNLPVVFFYYFDILPEAKGSCSSVNSNIRAKEIHCFFFYSLFILNKIFLIIF